MDTAGLNCRVLVLDPSIAQRVALLGLGKPNYSAFSNGSKLMFLVIGLPLGVKFDGLVGGVLVIALSDVARYIPVLVGQRRERFSFAGQDLLTSVGLFSLIASLEWLRWVFGLGTSFESLPIEFGQGFGFGWSK